MDYILSFHSGARKMANVEKREQTSDFSPAGNVNTGLLPLKGIVMDGAIVREKNS